MSFKYFCNSSEDFFFFYLYPLLIAKKILSGMQTLKQIIKRIYYTLGSEIGQRFIPSTAVWKPDTAAERVYRIKTIMKRIGHTASEEMKSFENVHDGPMSHG